MPEIDRQQAQGKEVAFSLLLGPDHDTFAPSLPDNYQIDEFAPDCFAQGFR